MIKFIEKDNQPPEFMTLELVEPNQFFVNCEGELCQKTYTDTYAVIAGITGNPYSAFRNVSPDKLFVRTILPHVHKIKF